MFESILLVWQKVKAKVDEWRGGKIPIISCYTIDQTYIFFFLPMKLQSSKITVCKPHGGSTHTLHRMTYALQDINALLSSQSPVEFPFMATEQILISITTEFIQQ